MHRARQSLQELSGSVHMLQEHVSRSQSQVGLLHRPAVKHRAIIGLPWTWYKVQQIASSIRACFRHLSRIQ